MIAKVAFIVVFSVFALKIAWNLVMPYTLVWSLIRSRAEESRRVSTMPFIEFASLVLMSIVAIFIDGGVPLFGDRSVILLGLALIAASYVHFAVVGALGGFVASRLNK